MAGRLKLYHNNSFQGKISLEVAALKWADQAITTLADIMSDVDAHPKQRIEACTAILDRAYGKPLERSAVLTMDSTEGVAVHTDLARLNTRDLIAYAASLSSRIIDLNQSTPGSDFETGGE